MLIPKVCAILFYANSDNRKPNGCSFSFFLPIYIFLLFVFVEQQKHNDVYKIDLCEYKCPVKIFNISEYF